MDEQEYERRVEALIVASRSVLQMFREGHNPTERQLDLLDGAISGLTFELTCGHRVTEDCSCSR